MGHLRLWKLPRTRKWVEVVALLKDPSSSVEQIAASSIEASKSGLNIAANDPALAHAFWLLAQIPLAARRGDFVENLRNLGLAISDAPTVLEIASSLAQSIDEARGGKRWSCDVGELARIAASESVTALAMSTTGGLFTEGGEATREAFKPLGSHRNFGILSRDFFARFTRGFLGYYLSRELPNHVGQGQRFASSHDHAEFNQALDLHCRQAARIVQDFAGGWFGKTEFEGGITPEKAKGFVHVALGKLRDELAAGAGVE